MRVADLKAFLKKSLAVHRVYKLLRNAGDVPPGRWLHLGQMKDVFNVLPNTLLPMPRLFDVYDAILAINREGLDGDIVECGVWKGGCVGLMAMADSKSGGPRRRIHLFDSFQGLPQPSGRDVEVIANFKAKYPTLLPNDDSGTELVAIGECVGNSQPVVEDFLVRRLKVRRDDLVFHKGWFQETIPSLGSSIEKIALLRMDGDWYHSTKVCFEGLYDRVVENGFVIVDDYGTYSGCREATDEFFRKRKIEPKLRYSDSDCVFFRKRQPYAVEAVEALVTQPERKTKHRGTGVREMEVGIKRH